MKLLITHSFIRDYQGLPGHLQKVVDGKLRLDLQPVLPGSYFDENNEVSFMFLGQTKVVYSNEKRIDTWNELSSKSIKVSNDDESYEFENYVDESIAIRIRNGEFKEIHVRME